MYEETEEGNYIIARICPMGNVVLRNYVQQRNADYSWPK